MAELKRVRPSERLSHLVSDFYFIESEADQVDNIERSTIAHFRHVFEGSLTVQFVDGQGGTLTGGLLQGPSTGAVRHILKGPFKAFGVGIMPVGWYSATTLSADLFTDRVLPAADIFPELVGEFAPHLINAPSFEAMVEITEQVISELDKNVSQEIVELARTVDEWLVSEPSPRVDVLLANCPQSPRQVLRLVRRIYGLPPKYLARKYRARRIARAILVGDDAEFQLLQGAYYDQSHMIRDVKFFTGQTPNQLRSSDAVGLKLVKTPVPLLEKVPPIIM